MCNTYFDYTFPRFFATLKKAGYYLTPIVISYSGGTIATFMSKNLYYEDVKIIKKPFKKRLKSFLIFFVCICVIVGVFLSSVFLSKALSVGNITSALVFGGTDINIKKHSFFIVSLGQYDSYDKAEKVSLGSNVQGASGYIWNMDNKYVVIGNIYKNKSDAESVQKNLKDTNYTVSIIEVEFPKIKLKFDYENKDVLKIREGIEFLDKSYDLLYDYSIKFDKSEINNFAISSGISSFRAECKIKISNIQEVINKYKDNSLSKINNALTKLDQVLNISILKTIENSSTNYSLKNAISQVVHIKYELYSTL